MPIPKNIQSWMSWILAVFFLLLQFNVQTAYAIINPDIQKTIGISLAQVALSATTYNVVYAICQLFGGAFLDRFGSRYTLLPAIILVAIGTYLYSDVSDITDLLISQVIIAIGASVSFVGAGYVGGQWFGSEKFGLFFGYVQALAGVSAAFSQLIIKKMIADFSWQDVLFAFFLSGIILFALFFTFFREPAVNQYQAEKRDSILSDMINMVLKHKVVFVIGLWAGMAFGSQLALGVVWAPKIFLLKGFSDAISGYSSMAIWLGLGAGALVWDKLGYYYKRKKLIITLGFITMIISLSFVLFSTAFAWWCYVMAMFAFGFGNGVHMLAFSCASDSVPVTQIGSASAIINTMFFIIGGTLISMPNFLMHYLSELSALACIVVLLILAMLIAPLSVEGKRAHA